MELPDSSSISCRFLLTTLFPDQGSFPPAVFLSRVQHDLERRIRPESDDMVVLDIHMRILPDVWNAVKVVEPDLEGAGAPPCHT